MATIVSLFFDSHNFCFCEAVSNTGNSYVGFLSRFCTLNKDYKSLDFSNSIAPFAYF